MGGKGSGRLPSTETIIKRMSPEQTPIGDGIFIPNYSGLQAVKKTDTPLSQSYYISGSVVADSDKVDGEHASAFEDANANIQTHVVGTGSPHTWAGINKTTSSIADITTKSHTALSDIGTNAHSAIDTHISNNQANAHGGDQNVLTTSSPQFANLIVTAGGDIKPSANSVTAINIAQADGTNFATFDTTNKQVLVGSNPDASAGYPLDVYKASTTTGMQSVAQFGIGSDGSPAEGEGVSINLGVPYTTSAGVQVNAGYIGLVRPNATASNYGGHMVFGTRTHGSATAERMRIDTDGNIGIGTTDQFGGGELVIGIANRAVAPTTNPTGGGVMYVSGGALYYRGSGGTIKELATA